MYANILTETTGHFNPPYPHKHLAQLNVISKFKNKHNSLIVK